MQPSPVQQSKSKFATEVNEIFCFVPHIVKRYMFAASTLENEMLVYQF